MYVIEAVSDGQSFRVEGPTLEEALKLWHELHRDDASDLDRRRVELEAANRAGCRKTCGKI